MKLLVAGSRNLRLTKLGFEYLDNIITQWRIVELVQGGANGIDMAAKKCAIYRGINVMTFPADWDLYGRSAGPKRNKDMIMYTKGNEDFPNYALFFPGGRGTINCLEQAKEYSAGFIIDNQMMETSFVTD